MNIGIAGFGNFGSLMAKAFMHKHSLYIYDRNSKTCQNAVSDTDADGFLDKDTLGMCDIVIVDLYPEKTVEYVSSNRDRFRKGCLVVDCCSIKQIICPQCFRLSSECGFDFIGGHPIIDICPGDDTTDRVISDKDTMILVPPRGMDESVIKRAKDFFLETGFGSITVSDAVSHDRITAFTSQLFEIVSRAYAKSPSAEKHKGFSLGSFEDFISHAPTDGKLCAELYCENNRFLVEEIDRLTDELKRYSNALKKKDKTAVCELIKNTPS